jgi:hypothetical protein
VVNSVAASGDREVSRDQHHGDDDAHQEGDDRKSAVGIGVSDLVGDPRSQEGTDRTKQDGHDDADVLLAGHDQSRQHTDDQSDDDGPDNRSDHCCSSCSGGLGRAPRQAVVPRP